MQLQNKIASMVNNTFIYRAKHHKILNFRIEEDAIHIVTNIRWLKFDPDKIESELKEFLPVEDDDEENKEVVNKEFLPVLTQAKENMPSLKNTILENIEKLKNDKGYIEQANAINQSINVFINMVKTELQGVKLATEIKGKK